MDVVVQQSDLYYTRGAIKLYCSCVCLRRNAQREAQRPGGCRWIRVLCITASCWRPACSPVRRCRAPRAAVVLITTSIASRNIHVLLIHIFTSGDDSPDVPSAQNTKSSVVGEQAHCGSHTCIQRPPVPITMARRTTHLDQYRQVSSGPLEPMQLTSRPTMNLANSPYGGCGHTLKGNWSESRFPVIG